LGKSTNNIDKIDEQIKNLIDEEKNVYEDNNDDGNEIIVDRKYAYDDVKTNGIETTKKLDSIDDVGTDISDEDTKKIDALSDIEDNTTEKEEVISEINNEKSYETAEEEISDVENSNEKEEKSEVIDDNISNVKKGKGIIWIIVSISAALIFLISFALFMFFGNDEKEAPKNVDNNSKTTLTKNEQKDIINKYGDEMSAVILSSLENDKKLLSYNEANKIVDIDYKVECSVHEIYEDGSIYLSKCKINDKKTTYSYGEKHDKKEENTDDDSIKIYVSKNDGTAYFNEPNDIDDYDEYSIDIDGNYSDLTLLNEDGDYVFYYDENNNVQMINYKKNKKALSPMNYISILPIKYDGVFDSSIVIVKSNGRWGIYNLNTRERLVGHKYESVNINLNGGTSGAPLFIEAIEKGKIAVREDGKFGVIDYNNGNEIIPSIYDSIIRSGSYLLAIDSKKNGHIFDYSGKEYLKGEYNAIYSIVDGSYVLVKDGSDLKLVKVNGKVYYNYGKVEHSDFSFGMIDNDEVIFQFYKVSGDDNNCIEVIYNNSSNTGEIKNITCGTVDISK